MKKTDDDVDRGCGGEREALRLDSPPSKYWLSPQSMKLSRLGSTLASTGRSGERH